ncbi:hypothetical protein CABS01_16667 [Colletotrichum abscissum]|uniref:uncharacterized protein n=1 Tax=Colletotrichum abscissum TaxID=1671311 RepID=UPI0027D61882|nr:uncharacterized protein CABS01_16667 [Colletotrichum abscissum]KAK1517389.1 hypothetical protein CABS01_16667 [Colletotrichum abscissum]
MIWKNAVRPHGCRGVHYFSVVEIPIVSLFTETEIFEQCHLVERVSEGQKQVLAAPLSTEDMTTPSWTAGNRSSYAIDGGLWTACKESRAAMHRRYNPTRGAPKRRIRFPSNDFATFKISDGKSYQWLSVSSESDLFVLQSIRCFPDFMRLCQELPFLSKEDGLVGVRHIAIGFDPTWTVEELLRYERITDWNNPNQLTRQRFRQQLSFMGLSKNRFNEYDSLVQASRCLRGRRTSKLWLIDSRLRRKQTVMQNHTMRVLGNWLYSDHGQQVFDEDGYKLYAMPDYASRDFYGDDNDNSMIAAEISRFVAALAVVSRHQDAVRRNVPEDDGYSERLGILVRE